MAARRLAARSSAALLVAAALCGCSVTADPFSLADNMARATRDRATIEGARLPVAGPLTLPEAIARAIKYNYDVQLSKLELATQQRQLELALAQMLPRASLDAGYSARSNDNAAVSIDEITRRRSLDYSYSDEPRKGTADIQFSWNLLDVGVSYFQARQQGDRALIALERRRKVMNGIVRTVTETYWRAAAAQRLLPVIEPMLERAAKMLSASRQAGSQSLQSPLTLLDFQQRMLQVTGELRKIRGDLESAQIQLASLINAPDPKSLVLSTPLDTVEPQIGTPPRRLEEIGLAMRPELRIEAYQQRIDRQDVYKEILKMMPGIGVLANGNYDSNALLYNPTWGELGVRATFNLMNLVQGPKAIAAAKSNLEADDVRRLALSVATVTEINLAYQQYAAALETMRTSSEVSGVGKQMVTASDNATKAGAQSESDRVRHKLAGIVAQMEYDRTLATAHSALANLYSAVGIDLVPVDGDSESLPELTERVRRTMSRWERGMLPEMPQQAAATGDAK